MLVVPCLLIPSGSGDVILVGDEMRGLLVSQKYCQLLIAALLIVGSLNLRAEEEASSLQVTEASVEEATVTEEKNELVIRVNDKTTYVIPGGIPDDVDQLGYESLDTLNKAQFHKSRMEVLQLAASLLNSTHLVYGFGSITKNTIQLLSNQLNRPTVSSNPIDTYAAHSLGIDVREQSIDQWLLEKQGWKDEKEKLAVKKSIRQRSHSIIHGVLLSLNKILWTQAPLAAKSQEFGVLLSLNAIFGAGVGNKVFGRSAGLGISLGYNKVTKSIVFEIIQDTEKITKALPTIGLGGAIGKFGFYMTANDHLSAPGKPMSSNILYPPVAPVFTSLGADRFVAGLNVSLTLPPSPIADMYAWTAESKTTTILRVSVSPLLKGFVKLQINKESGPIGAVIKSVIEFKNWVSSIVRSKIRSSQCHAVYHF